MKYLFIFLSLLCISQFSNAQRGMDTCPLKVGMELPTDLMLQNADDKEVTLEELTKEKPTILVFYRGAWCGYCTSHLAELQEIKGDIEELGYQILGIAPDRPSKLLKSQERSEKEIAVYSDATSKAIQAFGLDWNVDQEAFEKYKKEYKIDLEEWSGESHHNLPVPAIYIIKDGVVEFQYVNPKYSTRLKPATLLAVLQTL